MKEGALTAHGRVAEDLPRQAVVWFMERQEQGGHDHAGGGGAPEDRLCCSASTRELSPTQGGLSLQAGTKGAVVTSPSGPRTAVAWASGVLQRPALGLSVRRPGGRAEEGLLASCLPACSRPMPTVAWDTLPDHSRPPPRLVLGCSPSGLGGAELGHSEAGRPTGGGNSHSITSSPSPPPREFLGKVPVLDSAPCGAEGAGRGPGRADDPQPAAVRHT